MCDEGDLPEPEAPAGAGMICVHCHNPVESADDAVHPTEDGKCICRRCYAKMCGEPPLPTALRNEVESLLNGMGSAYL